MRKLNLISYFIVGLFICSTLSASHRSSAVDNDIVEINGESMYMIGHIMKLQEDLADRQANNFGYTHIFKFSDNIFTQTGSLIKGEISPSEIDEICRNNYVFANFYNFKDYRGKLRDFAAIIVGTTDKTLIERIKLAGTGLSDDKIQMLEE